MKMKVIITVCVALFFVFLLIGGAITATTFSNGNFYKSNSIDTTKTSATSGINSISISSNTSNVKIITDANAAVVTAHLYGTVFGFTKNKPTLRLTTNGDLITIDSGYDSWFMFFMWFNHIQLDITIPKSYTGAISCNSSAGRVDASDINSTDTVNIKSSAGEINATDITGKSVTIDSSAGRIVAENIKAEDTCTIKSSAGSVSMNGVTAKNLNVRNSAGQTVGKNITGATEINSSAGSVTISFKAVVGDIDVSSSAGSVVLSIPESTNATVSLHTSAGSVHTAFPITVNGNNSNNDIEGIIGKGGPMISAHSSAGSVYLNKN